MMLETPIIPRSSWGSQHGSGSTRMNTPVPLVVIHHTLKPALAAGTSYRETAAAIAGIEHYHVATNGWSAIGYNFLFDQDGRIWEGRGWGRVGAHAGDAHVNRASLGLAFLIDGNVELPSEEAWRSATMLIRFGILADEIAEEYQVTGHRDHAQRECPGAKLYAELGRLANLRGHTEVPRVLEHIIEFPEPPKRRLW
jgi:peptidoglycan recognition protein